MRLLHNFSILSTSAARLLLLTSMLVLLTSMLAGTFLSLCLAPARADDAKSALPIAPISYYKQIRPLIQAKCQGCHQASIPSGKYVMTSYADVMKGGASGACIVRKKPEASTADGISDGQARPDAQRRAAPFQSGVGVVPFVDRAGRSR